jgi:hypothetical protein
LAGRPTAPVPDVLGVGAGCVLGDVVQRHGASLREAFFINEFAVESLPYVIIVTALISLPSVGAFSRLMGRYEPEAVYKRLISMLRRLPSSASNMGLHGGRNRWCTALC